MPPPGAGAGTVGLDSTSGAGTGVSADSAGEGTFASAGVGTDAVEATRLAPVVLSARGAVDGSDALRVTPGVAGAGAGAGAAAGDVVYTVPAEFDALGEGASAATLDAAAGCVLVGVALVARVATGVGVALGARVATGVGVVAGVGVGEGLCRWMPGETVASGEAVGEVEGERACTGEPATEEALPVGANASSSLVLGA